jgi:hypothetical protein
LAGLEEFPRYPGLTWLDYAEEALGISRVTLRNRLEEKGVTPEWKPALRSNGRPGLKAYVPTSCFEQLRADQKAAKPKVTYPIKVPEGEWRSPWHSSDIDPETCKHRPWLTERAGENPELRILGTFREDL